jgi:hypothetical protein
VPPILIATLLVTVLVVDAVTPVEAKALPVTVGKVIVGVPATAGAAKVSVPLVSPEIVN